LAAQRQRLELFQSVYVPKEIFSLTGWRARLFSDQTTESEAVGLYFASFLGVRNHFYAVYMETTVSLCMRTQMQRRIRLGVMLAPAALGLMGCGEPTSTDDASTPLNPSTTGSGASSSPMMNTASASNSGSPASTPMPPIPSGPNTMATGSSSGAGGAGTTAPSTEGTTTASNTGTANTTAGGAAGGPVEAGGGAAGSSAGGAPMMSTTGGSAGLSGAAGLGGSAGAGTGAGGSAGTSGAAGAGGSAPTRPQRVLLYSFSTLDIPSVPAQLSILGEALAGWEFEVDESEDPAVLTDENLENYAAVGMINTCFSPFGENQTGDGPAAQALQNFVQAGGGLFGTHCASVAFQSVNPPPLYSELLGGRASSQYFEGTSNCRKEGEHATVAALPATFEYVGNLDATDFIAEDTTVLVHCTWSDPGLTDIPVSWLRTEGAGRVFFTSFGKVDADLMNATIGDNHILAGLAWVVGR
jgi:type 1 glutamine amidotransferase